MGRSGSERRGERGEMQEPQRLAPLRLPLPGLRRPMRRGAAFYVVSTADRYGRIADRSPLRALGWDAGRKVVIAAARDVLVVRADPRGRDVITSQGFLRIPSALRRRYRIGNRDRVLVCAFVDHQCLAVHTMAVLDEVFATRHAVIVEATMS